MQNYKSIIIEKNHSRLDDLTLRNYLKRGINDLTNIFYESLGQLVRPSIFCEFEAAKRKTFLLMIIFFMFFEVHTFGESIGESMKRYPDAMSLESKLKKNEAVFELTSNPALKNVILVDIINQLEKRINQINSAINHPHNIRQEMLASLIREFNAVQIWPVACDVNDCTDFTGKRWNTTGPQSATWFFYGNAGRWKKYVPEPNAITLIVAGGDECPGMGCLLGDIEFEVFEGVNTNDLRLIKHIRGPDNFCGIYMAGWLTSDSNELMIRAISGFYLTVYQIPIPLPL